MRTVLVVVGSVLLVLGMLVGGFAFIILASPDIQQAQELCTLPLIRLTRSCAELRQAIGLYTLGVIIGGILFLVGIGLLVAGVVLQPRIPPRTV